MTPIIGDLIETGLKIIDKVIPDPAAKTAAQLELMKLQQAGELEKLRSDTSLALGQIEVNKAEAASSDNFRSGWRPFIGWVCGSGFAIQFIVGPLGEWGTAIAGTPIKFPVMDLSQMMPLLFGMLGLGAYRSYERVNGKA